MEEALARSLAVGEARWADAAFAAVLAAIDPSGLGGLSLRSGPGPVRDLFLEEFLDLLPEGAPVRRAPAHVGVERLVGGLDLAAALAEGRAKVERGLLAEADGGLLLIAMAERLDRGAAAVIAAAIDEGVVRIERSGASRVDPARFLTLMLDEGEEAHERPPATLLERIAFQIELDAVPWRCVAPFSVDPDAVQAARDLLGAVSVTPEMETALDGACRALGAPSLRTLSFVLRAARASAALAGREAVEEADAESAVRLVLGARAAFAETDSEPQAEAAPSDPQNDQSPEPADDTGAAEIGTLQDRLIAAVAADVGAGLAGLEAASRRRRASETGAAGEKTAARDRGRPVGSRPGDPRKDGRLDVLATLRAAAPWKRLRGAGPGAPTPVRFRDLQVKHFEHRAGSAVIFVVDASGSAALHRLGEAKGAVERLLADCYARRDEVALIAFRGEGAELLLPPTRSLVRAKRALAQTPGGGGTPLAAGLAAAHLLAEQEAGRGRTPYIVVLSDGRANIALDRTPGRPQAMADAERLAKKLADAPGAALFFDTGPRPDPRAAALAALMQADYRPLPAADGATISRAVRSALGSA
ncbi:MAG: magnesium chelatase subunit D [Pseudomonadota bacterium]